MSKRKIDPIDMLLSQALVLEAEGHTKDVATKSHDMAQDKNLPVSSKIGAGRARMISTGVPEGGRGRGFGRGHVFGDINRLVVPQGSIGIGRGRGLMPPKILAQVLGSISSGHSLAYRDVSTISSSISSCNNDLKFGSVSADAILSGDHNRIVVGTSSMPMLQNTLNSNQKMGNGSLRGSAPKGILANQDVDMTLSSAILKTSQSSINSTGSFSSGTIDAQNSTRIKCVGNLRDCIQSKETLGAAHAMLPKPDVYANLHVSKVIKSNNSETYENKLNMKIQKIMNELDDDVNCRYCHDTCTPPFMSCPNGHLFCDSCIKIMPGCQVCTYKNIDCRQHFLEKVAMTKEWPCHHKVNGCGELLKLDKLKDHIDTCRYKIQNCCLIVGCNSGFVLNKIAFVKHMDEIHNIQPIKIDGVDFKSTHVETNYEMTDFLKNDLDLAKKIETVEIYEISQCFFMLIVEETSHDLSFRNYVMGESNEQENRFFCSRRFVDNDKKYKYAIVEPMTSISGRVANKRKYASMQNDEFTFNIKKHKLEAIYHDETKTDCNKRRMVNCLIMIDSS